MKKVFFIVLVISCMGTLIGVSGCAKENEEDLLLNQQLCRVDTVSFSQHIQPYINAHCMSCHNTVEQEGGIILETWADVSGVAAGGALMGAMKHEPGYKAMPNNGPKSSDCVIQGFELWISQGAMDN